MPLLLALNANIEAARAGGGSDGFAVVADEVSETADEQLAATSRATAQAGSLAEQPSGSGRSFGTSRSAGSRPTTRRRR